MRQESPEEAETHGGPVPLERKVAFLRRPDAHAHGPARVEAVETRWAWVFLAGSEAYKLKKPVNPGGTDFGRLDVRKRACKEEVRLNRRLAPGVYRDVVALRRSSSGELSLEGEGEVVEWMIRMQRLPRRRMLDARLAAGNVRSGELHRLAETLVRFYERAPRIPMTPREYLDRMRFVVASSRNELVAAPHRIPVERAESIARGLFRFLAKHPGLFHARVRSGRIVEGHGDLRAEHVCLLPRPVVIDCLEFDRDLRILDPTDDLAFLAVECVRLEATEVAERILGDYQRISGDAPPPELLTFYKSFRSFIRSKVALRHLKDRPGREPGRWLRSIEAHLDLARFFLPSA